MQGRLEMVEQQLSTTVATMDRMERQIQTLTELVTSLVEKD